MGKAKYSVDLVRRLRERIASAQLLCPPPSQRYEPGDVLELPFTTVWPERGGRGRFRIERYAGSGFAGQVYRCVLERLDFEDGARHGLRVGNYYAVKIMVPTARGARLFRDLLYWLAYQAPFGARVNSSACRAGLLWQKFARAAAGAEFGDPGAVADVYASFYDPDLGSFGEIREWVEGRTWRLEPDDHPALRRRWRTVDARATGSPEFVAKRQFMHRFVRLLRGLGARELARQYEWWTMKSQPNVLKRAGSGGDPAKGLCAVDFRAGLALLPFLPMSPRDVGLIVEGLAHGALVQFDRCDPERLRRRVEDCPEVFQPLTGAVAALADCERAYRRAQPDLTRQGLRLLWDRGLRADVRAGLASAYAAVGLIEPSFATRLARSPWRFLGFQALGAVPLAGRLLRRLWGHRGWRRHARRWFTEGEYRGRALRAGVAHRVIGWLRAGRCGDARGQWLADRPAAFWTQRLTLGLLPRGLHRLLAEPGYALAGLRDGWRFLAAFFRDAAFRERWLRSEIEAGHAEGMLSDAERDRILARIGEPFIATYLKCLAVHFATLPVTQIVSVSLGIGVGIWLLSTGRSWEVALAWFGAIVVFFQMVPISPGSLCRGGYVVYRMIRDRNARDYLVAAPLSFAKYIGYLAFPIQMVATYPELSQFMAGRWATGAARVMPVFGEKGALFEHMVYDLAFNRVRLLAHWCGRRLGLLLTLWMLLGVGGAAWAWTRWGSGWGVRQIVNLTILVSAVFVLPRLLAYPLLRRKRRSADVSRA